jgi:hypothetical protein
MIFRLRLPKWLAKWYGQLPLILVGACVAYCVGSRYSGAAGIGDTYVESYVALGVYSCLLLLFSRLSRIVGLALLVVSIWGYQHDKQERARYIERMLENVRERDRIETGNEPPKPVTTNELPTGTKSRE